MTCCSHSLAETTLKPTALTQRKLRREPFTILEQIKRRNNSSRRNVFSSDVASGMTESVLACDLLPLTLVFEELLSSYPATVIVHDKVGARESSNVFT